MSVDFARTEAVTIEGRKIEFTRRFHLPQEHYLPWRMQAEQSKGRSFARLMRLSGQYSAETKLKL